MSSRRSCRLSVAPSSPIPDAAAQGGRRTSSGAPLRTNCRVLFEGGAFIRHFRSGITRYFAQLIGELESDPSLAVTPVTPFRYVSNEHLTRRFPGRYRRIPLPNRWRPSLLGRLNRRAAFDAPPVDVVHFGLYDPAAFERWGAPLRVCTIYDFTFETLREMHPNVESHLRDKRFYLENCDAVLCISRTTRDDLRRFHPEIEKPTFVTPLGVSPSFFTPRRQPIRRLPDRYLLHVGSRYEHKNVDVLLRAFAELARRDSSLHLALCGAGLPTESARLEALGISSRIVRLRVSDDQLPWLYHRAQAFVFPSLYEGFGLPVLEAMAAGCPAVIADAPALVEVAADAAVSFPATDVEALVSRLEALLGDAERGRRLRDAGVARAREFSWRRTAETTAAAYSAVLGNRGG